MYAGELSSIFLVGFILTAVAIGVLFYRYTAGRNRAESQLRATLLYARGLIEASLDPLVTINADGKISDVNRATEEVTGVARKELIGSDFSDYFTEPEMAREGYRQVFSEGFVRDYPLDIRHASGRVTNVLYNATIYKNESGEVQGVFAAARDITKRKQAEEALEQMHRQLLETAREAGMAEVAVNVLHNVGNVLNSVNVSAELICQHLDHSEVKDLNRVLAVMEEHLDDLATFITADEKGKHLPAYLLAAGKTLEDEHAELMDSARSIGKSVEHIKAIVGMQQSYTLASGLVQVVDLAELLDDALRLNTSSFDKHGIKITREYEDMPEAMLDRHKLLQVVVNLLKNAKEALLEVVGTEKTLTVRLQRHGEDRVRLQVIDNGVGISKENLQKIFSHGFTTKAHGHGFGLHGCANLIQEMDGALSVRSDGPGRGATFTIELPLAPMEVTTQ